MCNPDTENVTENVAKYFHRRSVLPTKKAEPCLPRGVNRDSGTDSANGSGDFHEKAVKVKFWFTLVF